MSSRLFRDDLLEGQVCLISGGGTGIGAACAREMARLGATVIPVNHGDATLRAAIDEALRDLTGGKKQHIGIGQAFQLCGIAPVAAGLAQLEAGAGEPVFGIFLQAPLGGDCEF